MASGTTSTAEVVPAQKTGPKKKPRKTTPSAVAKPAPHSLFQVAEEVFAVLLCCVGLLSLLALVSYSPADPSLNSAGSSPSHRNWIGPAGAYGSDLLLQALGVGAYVLSLGVLLAGWRSLVGRRVLPGLREASGSLMFIACGGALAELVVAPGSSYPAGGVGGALIAAFLRENFALLGAAIIASALVLVSLAVTADGMLRGLGLRGLSFARDAMSRVRAAITFLVEQRRHLATLRKRATRTPAETPTAAPGPRLAWSWNEEQERAREVERKRRVEDAKRNAEARAEAKIEQESVRTSVGHGRSRPAPSLPDIVLDQTVDLPADEGFVLGKFSIDDDECSAVEPGFDDIEPAPALSVRRAVAAAAEPERTAATDFRKAEVPVGRNACTATAPPSEPEIVDVRPEVDTEKLETSDEHLVQESAEFELPSTALLEFEAKERAPIDPAKLRDNAQKLVRTLKEFKIDGTIREIRPGPVVTMYEFVPAPGIKISKIAGLADDIAMSMAAMRVRIVAPIPGKGAVGIEIPNDDIETVFYKEIISNDVFKNAKSKLTIALGKDIEGKAVVANLAKMPHLLVAGATGAGKSVSVNAMIMSILFKATPREVRFIMVDPKMLELSVYNGIPHLLLPVVTDPKKASLALRWAVEEMERRYRLLSEAGVKNIDGFNDKVRSFEERGKTFHLPPEKDGEPDRPMEHMPYIVVIVDELADLMMVASREVEASIMRMAQMARAAGIHLILATQRPSVDVITGSIKANLPTRIAFRVAQKNDSRTILDQNGAQNLLGRGDMLFMSNGASGVNRVHGAFVNEDEVERTVEFIKGQGTPRYDESILAPRTESSDSSNGLGDDERDEMYDKAIAIVTETRQASISMIQRKLKIGYNRAARLVEHMEEEGIVGPPDGAKPRAVLAPAPPGL